MDPFHQPDSSPDFASLGNPNFDSFPDINYPPSPQHFPGTPSYNGSYQNSPYSNTSELVDFEYKEQPDSLGLFNHNADLDYDPSQYDAPSSNGPSLFTFNEDFLTSGGDSRVSLSITPAAEDMASPSSGIYDHSSPGSSNGGGESENDYRHHSPASSISSHPRRNNASPHIPFNDLHVASPYMPGGQLPGGDRTSSPNLSKPPSPPQLVIPESAGQRPIQTPIINAPAGDGGLSGPQLHIVPATPVVGGDDPSQSVAYNNNNYMQQASRHTASEWPQTDPAASAGPSRFVGQSSPFAFPGSDSRYSLGGGAGGGHHSNGSRGHMSSASEDFLLPPSPSRMRSKSDTSLRPPQPQQWTTSNDFNHHQGALPDLTAFGSTGVNMNQVLPPVSDLDSSQQLSSSLRNTSSPSPSYGHQLLPQSAGLPFDFSNNGLLSPDVGASLRRARSDGGSSMRNTHRQVRSEDLRSTVGNNSLYAANYPPSAHQDFIRNQQQQQQMQMNSTTFLQPEPVMSINRGHHRRTSSGSRERGAGGGLYSGVRMSPYPSPNASPSHMLGELPNVNIAGHQRNTSGHDVGSVGGGMSRASTPGPVAKPNVTTSATADASMKRRINEAKFVCDVPGCGSTFTRHFNLKGHKRSHMDEKPFQCKWPGCGKGFARQHDCKRHEQLHSNHRPFTCEGCKKPFARLDALNRHLKSEGGAGCARIQETIDAERAQAGGDQQQQQGGGMGALMAMQGQDLKLEGTAADWMGNGVVM